MVRKGITWAAVTGLLVASGTTEIIKLISFDGLNLVFIVSGDTDNFILHFNVVTGASIFAAGIKKIGPKAGVVLGGNTQFVFVKSGTGASTAYELLEPKNSNEAAPVKSINNSISDEGMGGIAL